MEKVFTIGEALIDFIPAERGTELKAVSGFSKAAGGAPANVACAVARLGGESAFIGKLGKDAFGDFLLDTMNEAGVDTSRVFRTDEANTALAFVSLRADGEREFSFYRNPSADMLLQQEEIDERWFGAGDILHFCSVDLIEAPVKYAHKKAIEAVKRAGGIVSFDPNVRLPLWKRPELCRDAILAFLPFSHIVKISDEELAFITGMDDEDRALASLFTGDVRHVIYTRGAQGAEWITRGFRTAVPGYAIQVADTTGAGDSFIGALLYRLLEERLPANEERGIGADQARALLTFANAAAALTTSRSGAIPALPVHDEVLRMMEEHRA